MKKIFLSLFLFTMSAYVFQSCVSKRKIMSLNNELGNQRQQEMTIQEKLNSLDSSRSIKEKKGELDNQSSSSIHSVLNKELNASKKRVDNINSTATTVKKGMKRRNFKNAVTFNLEGTAIITEKKEQVLFVDDLLKQQNFAKFNTATFFSTGGFAIPNDKIKEAETVFSPILDSMISFVKKYPSKQMNSSIVCYGYADEQPFKPYTELWRTLTTNLNDTNATRQSLNVELSRLRSEDVSSILQSLLHQKSKLFPDRSISEVQFIKIGKGEEYPNKTITDYTASDERRRIVVVFWNALPKEFDQP
jgi:hypothetical protein